MLPGTTRDGIIKGRRWYDANTAVRLVRMYALTFTNVRAKVRGKLTYLPKQRISVRVLYVRLNGNTNDIVLAVSM